MRHARNLVRIQIYFRSQKVNENFHVASRQALRVVDALKIFLYLQHENFRAFNGSCRFGKVAVKRFVNPINLDAAEVLIRADFHLLGANDAVGIIEVKRLARK